MNQKFIEQLLISGAKTPDDLARVKRKVAKELLIPCPSNVALLKIYHEMVGKGTIKKSPKYNLRLTTGQAAKIENLLRVRPIRSLSGIVNVSVLTKPYPCPGKCLYCPTEKGIPKSYVSGEPAVERAKTLNYNPYLQVKRRLEMLETEGHPTDKIELRIVGGTWSFYPKKYQSWFIKRCFRACNEKNADDLKQAQKINEKAKYRIIGLSIETRPDFVDPNEIKHLRELGVTMVELGIQSIYNDILKKNLRGHKVKEIISATKLLKDAGFKVLYQMMPNLPGSSPKRDLKMFQELFANQRFRPDLLKIYPCALVKEAPLYKLWKEGKYKPYTEKQLVNLIKSIKKIIPYYVRIQRIARDIPSHSIIEGPAKISNLRQMVAGDCRCIRCREVKENYDPKEKIYLFRQDYEASGGQEIFLSFENENRSKLYSLLRLRITSQNKAIIREIHTYGQLQPINKEQFSAVSPQHKGLGKRLVEEAEKISKKESASRRIAVISGIGARDYWRHLGYQLEKTYVVKKI